MPELHWAEVLVRVVLAGVLGGAIGAEREIREREAGLRTHMLVAVGAALFTIVSAYAWSDFQFSTREGITFDPTRIAAQVVTGIGFLGAGAIIRQGLSIRGLTTAASLWVVAAIGMASGAGYYSAAVITTVLVLVSLWPLRILAFRIFERIRPGELRLEVELRANETPSVLLDALEGQSVAVRAFELEDARDRQARGARSPARRGPSRGGHGRAHAPRASARGAVGYVATLASANENKLRELEHALAGWEIDLLEADEYPPETGETYYDNALAKARFGRTVADPTRWVLGEDSGVEIAGLGGRPGVQSSRWAAGREAERALEELEGVEDRRARYVCELVAISPEGAESPRNGDPRRPNRRGSTRLRRLRLRPGLRARGRGADRGRAGRRLEARELPPRPRRPSPPPSHHPRNLVTDCY